MGFVRVALGVVIVALLSGCRAGQGASHPPSGSPPTGPAAVVPNATQLATGTPSASPTLTALPTPDLSEPMKGPLDAGLAASLPKELLSVPFEVVGIDPGATVRDVYDPAIGAAIARHFDRAPPELMLALARARNKQDRRGIGGFEILAIRMPHASVAQVVGAYIAEAISRPGGKLDGVAIGDGSMLAWSDDVLYIFSFDIGRLLEMYEASPREVPIVDIDELRAAAARSLRLPDQRPGPSPALLSSPPPTAPAPDLEALLPAEVSGRTMRPSGSWASLQGGVTYFTFDAALIAHQTGRSLADASAAIAAPSDGLGQPVTVIRFVKGQRDFLLGGQQISLSADA